MPTPEPVSRLA